MNIWIAAVLVAMVSVPVHAATEIAPHVEQVTFNKGSDTVKFARSIKGPLTAQYRLNAKAGQMMTVDFKSSNASAYFNITAKGADYALFNDRAEVADDFIRNAKSKQKKRVYSEVLTEATKRQNLVMMEAEAKQA